MAYYEQEPTTAFGNESTEKSIKSCYAVVYELENRKWVVAGEGGWSEVHLCEDSSDSTHRILAWTVKSQQVLMNCNVTLECAYKEKSKNFHSFSDENGNRYGLGFHKSESGLKQAAHFLKAVIAVIQTYKEQPQPPPPPNNAMPSQQQQQVEEKQNAHNPNYNQQQSVPPPMMSQQQSPSPQPNGFGQYKSTNIPQYHLTNESQKSIPTESIGPFGVLKILPAKTQKHFSGDKKIKNPTAVEHTTRVTHDKETGLYSGLPQEWMDHLNKQFGVNPKLLPGVELQGYDAKIPKVLVRLRHALEEHDAYQQVGIFRLAPNASDNNAIKSLIDKGKLNESEEQKVDVNVYANLLKVWFRDLPDPLLNCANPDQIEHVSTSQQAGEAIAGFVEPNKSIFLWLCDMCVDIGRFEKTNKMGPQNMAIVVGPNLFNTDKFENPMKAMTYSGKVVEFFKHAIMFRAEQKQKQQQYK